MKNDAFDRIIGYSNIKQELKEIADVLAHPEEYERFCVKEPAGLILEGNPGVGKTLMANCLIEASGRPNFICRKDESDENFIEKIKITFEKALENAPSIVFLDDIDKFSNDDEFHVNSAAFITIQSCMDMVKNQNVFVVATENDSSIMPISLFRSGRFDQIIRVNNPEDEEAKCIIEHFLSEKQSIGKDIDVDIITKIMHGRSCADLETVINQAGLCAGYEGSEEIHMSHIFEACLKALYNAPSLDLSLSKHELEARAYHEAGHAVISEILHPESVAMVTIRTDRLFSGGFTASSYRRHNSVKELEFDTLVALAGKAATEIRFGENDGGCSSDINKAFNCTRKLVCELDTIGFEYHSINPFFHDENASEEKKARRENIISSEVYKYYDRVKEILIVNWDFLERIVDGLLKDEVLTIIDIQNIKEELLEVA